MEVNDREVPLYNDYKHAYCIAGKFGGELSLAVWRYAFKLPN